MKELLQRPISRRTKVVLVLMLAAILSAFFFVPHLTLYNPLASTPEKTIWQRCEALLKGDYIAAYQFFSREFKKRVSQEQFVSDRQEDGPATLCTVVEARIVEDGTAWVYVTYADHGEYQGNGYTAVVHLRKEDGWWWKIG